MHSILVHWWREIASKVPEEVVQHWFEHMPEDKDSRVINGMRATLEEESQARRCVTPESSRNRVEASI